MGEFIGWGKIYGARPFSPPPLKAKILLDDIEKKIVRATNNKCVFTEEDYPESHHNG